MQSHQLHINENRRLVDQKNKQEELDIALQAAHEVNSHLNQEVEQLTHQVEVLQRENSACILQIKCLGTKLAEERRCKVESDNAKQEEARNYFADNDVPDVRTVVQPGTNSCSEDWLQEPELQRVKSMGLQRGWLIDPQEVVLGKIIGQGAFGITHEATWRGGIAAVKCIRVSNRNEIVSFLREAEALSLIRHANVLPMYGACIEPPEHCWLVCEYLPGGTLADWLYGQKGSRLSPNRSLVERLQMALDVGRGMQALEQSSPPILHRDLKPSNVFIDSAGHARVADMGLARVLTPSAMVSLTGETGTYQYMSPECIRHEMYDSRSDVWSWGVLCVELLMQQKPYMTLYATPVQVALQVAEGKLHPNIPARTHPLLKELLLSCFDPDPMGRPSFGLIVAQLTHIVNAVTKSEVEKQFDHSWGKWWGKASTVAAAAAAVAPPILKRASHRDLLSGKQHK